MGESSVTTNNVSYLPIEIEGMPDLGLNTTPDINDITTPNVSIYNDTEINNFTNSNYNIEDNVFNVSTSPEIVVMPALSDSENTDSPYYFDSSNISSLDESKNVKKHSFYNVKKHSALKYKSINYRPLKHKFVKKPVWSP